MFNNSKILNFPNNNNLNKENQRDLNSVPIECLTNLNRIFKVREIRIINQKKLSDCQSFGSLSKTFYGQFFCAKAKQDFEIAQKMEYDLIRDLPKDCSFNNNNNEIDKSKID